MPNAPAYRALDERLHIGSVENLELLMLNISDMAAYAARLEAALMCYEISNAELNNE